MKRFILAITVLWGLSIGLLTQAETNSVEGNTDEVEQLEVVETVAVAQVRPPVEPDRKTLSTIVGRFHSAAVHLPLGLLLAFLLVELVGLKRPEMTPAGVPLIVTALAALVPAAVTGFLRAAEQVSRGLDDGFANEHRNMMLGMLVLVTVTAGVRIWSAKTGNGRLRRLYLAIGIAATLLAFAGAHEGGELVFGPDFFIFS